MIHLYYGYGKGKTTAAVGLATRMLGSRKAVLYVSFLKDGSSNEFNILTKYVNLKLIQNNFKGFYFQLTEDDREKAKLDQLELLREGLRLSKEYDLIILDELLDLIDLEIISEQETINYLKQFNANCEIVITGHSEYIELIDLSDYCVEFNSKKHPYDKGVTARKGIEY